MSYILILLALCSNLLFSFDTPSRDSIPMRFEVLTMKHGLSQGLVMSIIQDKDGFMWFSTKDGLNKYDGYRMTVYRNNPNDPYSLPDNYVTVLTEDSSGNIWVGTDTKGIFLFDKKQERFYPVRFSDEDRRMAHESIYTIQFNGSVLMIASNQFVCLYDASSFLRMGDISTRSLVLPRPIFSMATIQFQQSFGKYYALMPDKSLWWCNKDSLYVLEPNTTGQYVLSHSYSNAQIHTSNTQGEYTVHHLPNTNHKLFIEHGMLFVYDFAQKKKIVEQTIYHDILLMREVTIRDDNGNYLLLSGTNANYSFNTTTYQLTPIVCLGFMEAINRGYKHCYDKNNVLWLGTTGHGVLKYDPRKHVFHLLKNMQGFFYTAFRNNEVFGWLSTTEPAIYNLRSQSYRSILPTGYWKREWQLWSIIQSSEDTFLMMILNTYTKLKYLVLYNTHSGKSITIPYPYMATLGIQNFMKDNNGHIWSKGTDYNGKPFIMKIDVSTLSMSNPMYFPTTSEFNEYPFVSGYVQDQSGVFWFATLHGLFRFDHKKGEWNHYPHNPRDASTLPPKFLFSICADPKQPEKYLWIGSNGGGLSRFDKTTGRAIHFLERDGLPNSVVYAITTDNAKNLWFSTNKGLSCLKLVDNLVGKAEFINFTTDDGLVGDEFNRYEVMKIADGTLIFGGPDGKTLFNPAKLLVNDQPPNIVITNLAIFNKTVTHHDDSTIVSSNISYADRITLHRQHSMFTISFSALNYGSQHKKVYKYILEGFDADWVESGSKNEATYTTLPPGTYTFRVIGAVAGGLWNMKGASIQIVVEPEWWQTWWFKLLLGLTIVVVIGSVIRYRFYQTMKVYATSQ